MSTEVQLQEPPVRRGDRIVLTSADGAEHVAEVLTVQQIQGVYVVTASAPGGLYACTVSQAKVTTPIDLPRALSIAVAIVNGGEPRVPVQAQALTLATALLGLLGGATDAA